jgi:TRAP-type C4-dicarboxylate transport system permease small subunit
MKRGAMLTLKVLAVLIAALIVAFVGIIVLAIVFRSGLGDPCPPYC